MSDKFMKTENCLECEYHRRMMPAGKQSITSSYIGCYCPPYFGRYVRTIHKCPKDDKRKGEQE